MEADTLCTSDNVYLVEGNLGIPAGVTLAIEAGTRVLVDGGKIQVLGNLELLGESGNPVYITSDGSWEGIEFLQGSKGLIEESVIEKSSAWGLFIYTGGVTVLDTIIRDNNGGVIFRTAGDVFEGNSVHSNKLGISWLQSGVKLKNNKVYDNSTGISFNSVYSDVDLTSSDIFNNVTNVITVGGTGRIIASDVYWGLLDRSSIEDSILHYQDDLSRVEVIFEPWRETALN